MAKTVPNDGLIRFQGFLDTEHLLLTNPEALNEVLIKRSYDFIKPPGAVKIFNQFLGRTFLFVTEGIQHREAKRIMHPPFSFRQVQDMYPVFWAKATDMANSIELSAPRDEQGALVADVELWAHEATLDAIFGTMFGQHFLDSPHKNELLKLYETVLSPRWDVQIYFMLTAFLPLWTLKLIPGDISQRVDAASSSLRQAVKALIEDRKGDVEKKSHKDIVIQLIERDYFTDEELVSNILGLLIAG
jgi:cytochrome P450